MKKDQSSSLTLLIEDLVKSRVDKITLDVESNEVKRERTEQVPRLSIPHGQFA